MRVRVRVRMRVRVDLEMSVTAQKNVFRFQVPVDNVHVMQVLEGESNLRDVNLNPRLFHATELELGSGLV